MAASSDQHDSRSRIRDGLIIAVIVMLGAVGIRFIIGDPIDPAHYEGLGAVTGLDFGDWPQFFYAGGGGDGEIFAVIAADPLGSGPGQEIPVASYRYSRIGFPLVAWMLSIGQSELILPALALIGLLSIGAIGFVSGYQRERLGMRSWFLVANPVIYLGFNGDTSEPFGLAVLILALSGSGIWAAMTLGATRPTFATALIGRWRLLAGAGAIAILVRIFVVWRFSTGDMSQLGQVFAPPLVGYFEEISIAGLLLATAALATLVIGSWRRDLAWILSGLFVLTFGPVVVEDPANALRAAGVLPVLWAFGTTHWYFKAREPSSTKVNDQGSGDLTS